MENSKCSLFTNDNLADEIVKLYAKYNVRIALSKHTERNGKFIFRVKMKGNTRESHVRIHASDVQLRLRLPVFYVDRQDFDIFIIVSQIEIEYPRLPTILGEAEFQTFANGARLPYVVGCDIWENINLDDLSRFPHLLLGGSTNSGKTVALQTMIASIAYTKSQYQVNFILVDVGAADLLVFEKLPHLSCPVIRDRITAAYVLEALTAELERRIELEQIDRLSFQMSPTIVVVIDEFSALFLGVDKAGKQAMIDNVSNLLQRGRHAKIHIVLAAQNPSFQNMRVDLGNITARIAFKCAKKNFSEIILGEPGAEKLAGNGDMLLKLPNSDLQRMQGIYVTKEELVTLVKQISSRELIKSIKHTSIKKTHHRKRWKFTIDISNEISMNPTANLSENLSCAVIRKGVSEADRLFASVVLWTLEHNSISTNRLMITQHLGWNKATVLIKRLEELGIVAPTNSKLPREVIPNVLEDLPDELLEFLDRCDYPRESVISAFQKRKQIQRATQSKAGFDEIARTGKNHTFPQYLKN